MTLKFLTYETLILGIDITFWKRNERRSLEIISEKSNDFLYNFLDKYDKKMFLCLKFFTGNNGALW